MNKFLKKHITLSPPHLSGNELKYIQLAFENNQISSEGVNIDEFENSLRQYLGHNKQVAALSSGTSGLIQNNCFVLSNRVEFK